MNIQVIFQLVCLAAIVLSGPLIVGILSTQKSSL